MLSVSTNVLLHVGQSALLIGATGATGKYLLKELLSSSHFTRVGEYGRRVTPLDQITSGQEKLEQKTVNFEKLEDAGLNAGKWDVVFITYYFKFEYSHP
jgi:oxidoreductase